LWGIAEAPLYLNGVSGLGSPDWVPDFESRFVGCGSPLQKLAAVYQSVVFLIARNLDRMRGRLPLERVVLTGGLARVDWVAKQVATLANLPVERPANAEATLRGLFVLLRSGAHECAAPPQPSDTFLPVPCDVTQRRYSAWTLALEDSVEAGRRVAPCVRNG
jgi:sugar (pentulose or hexulose) kinase